MQNVTDVKCNSIVLSWNYQGDILRLRIQLFACSFLICLLFVTASINFDFQKISLFQQDTISLKVEKSLAFQDMLKRIGNMAENTLPLKERVRSAQTIDSILHRSEGSMISSDLLMNCENRDAVSKLRVALSALAKTIMIQNISMSGQDQRLFSEVTREHNRWIASEEHFTHDQVRMLQLNP